MFYGHNFPPIMSSFTDFIDTEIDFDIFISVIS